MSDAAAHVAQAQAARDAGDSYVALIHQRRAVALLRGGDPATLAHAIRHVADMLVEAGQAEDAAAPVAEMLALYRAMPAAPPLDLAKALRCAAVQATATGDTETAAVFWVEARSRYAGLGIEAGVADAAAHLARLRD